LRALIETQGGPVKRGVGPPDLHLALPAPGEVPKVPANRSKIVKTGRAGQTLMSTNFDVAGGRLGQPFMSRKRARRIAIFVVLLAPALYFVPVVTIFYLCCGALDIYRQQNVTFELVEKYFMGNGLLTWALSPINLLADLVSHKNRLIYRLEDLPPDHRREIETCVQEFIANGDRIKEHVAKQFGDAKRCMLTFKWYDTPQSTDLKIPAFERDYRYIKTIAVSVFNTRESTSRHFGPLRLTFRVLYNLDPAPGHDVFIEADGQTNYWSESPLFIFDDTIFHRSVNNVDHVRYCLFMDIVRPTYVPRLLDIAVHISSAISGSFKRMFYKNWSFIR
jgi:aspartyl/asparaginyl beta-hydroxylase (cupin superfamily)